MLGGYRPRHSRNGRILMKHGLELALVDTNGRTLAAELHSRDLAGRDLAVDRVRMLPPLVGELLNGEQSALFSLSRHRSMSVTSAIREGNSRGRGPGV